MTKKSVCRAAAPLVAAGLLVLAGCSPYAALRHDPESHVQGTAAPGFAEVKQAFVENFKDRKELGAACAVYYKGEKVVDLWGGYRDIATRAPWEENTLVTVFSTSKGISRLHLRSCMPGEGSTTTSAWPPIGPNSAGTASET